MTTKAASHPAEIVKYEPAYRRLPIELAIQSNRNGRNFNQDREKAEGFLCRTEQQLNLDTLFQLFLGTERQSLLSEWSVNLTNNLFAKEIPRRKGAVIRDLRRILSIFKFELVPLRALRPCTVPHEGICTFSNEFHTLSPSPLSLSLHSPNFCLSYVLCYASCKICEWSSLRGRCSLADGLKQSSAPLSLKRLQFMCNGDRTRWYAYPSSLYIWLIDLM